MKNSKVTNKELSNIIVNDTDHINVDVSGVTDMSYMFKDGGEVKYDVSNWDVSDVSNALWL